MCDTRWCTPIPTSCPIPPLSFLFLSCPLCRAKYVWVYGAQCAGQQQGRWPQWEWSNTGAFGWYHWGQYGSVRWGSECVCVYVSVSAWWKRCSGVEQHRVHLWWWLALTCTVILIGWKDQSHPYHTQPSLPPPPPPHPLCASPPPPQDTPVLQYPVMATTSDNVTAAESIEHDMSMPEDFFQGIKGAHYSQCGKYITGYADSFEELKTVVDQHAQVGLGRGEMVVFKWRVSGLLTWLILCYYGKSFFKPLSWVFMATQFIWIGVCFQECINDTTLCFGLGW